MFCLALASTTYIIRFYFNKHRLQWLLLYLIVLNLSLVIFLIYLNLVISLYTMKTSFIFAPILSNGFIIHIYFTLIDLVFDNSFHAKLIMPFQDLWQYPKLLLWSLLGHWENTSFQAIRQFLFSNTNSPYPVLHHILIKTASE